MTDFLHGVETIVYDKGNVPIKVVKSAVIALVGIAPIGTKNTPIVVNNVTDAAQFGEQLIGFTIPQALADIFKQGAGTVIVVNVMDDTAHVVAVTAESQTVLNRAVKLAFAPVGGVAIVVTNSDASVTYTLDTDYTYDAFGNVTIINDNILESDVLKVTYKKLDAAAVIASYIIGSVSGAGVKKGLKCYQDAYNLFGFRPKIIIAPGYSVLSEVASEMQSVADANRGLALIDAPSGTTVANAILGRGPSGAINFYTAHKRSELCFPMLKTYDPTLAANADRPYSQFLAGLIAANDNANGYWYSPSNVEIKGIVGLERNITAAINDPNCEASLLNAVGITTVFGSFGTGFLAWGNRNASFPASSLVTSFIAVQRTRDVIDESIELASLPFVDKPINQAIIDSIVETVNAFFRVLVGRGAIIDGECRFIRSGSQNTDAQIAAGQLVFDNTFLPPTPLERLTYNSVVDVSLLKKLS